MAQKLASMIWNFSEYYNIPLGHLAPHVFGVMIGAHSWRRIK